MSVLLSQFHFHKAHPLLQAALWHKSVGASWSSNPGTRSHGRWHSGLRVKRPGARPHSASSVFCWISWESIYHLKISLHQERNLLSHSTVNAVQLLLQNDVQQMSWTCGGKEMCPWINYFIFQVTNSSKHYLYITTVERLHVLHLPLLPNCQAPENRQGKSSTLNKNTFNKEILHPDIWSREVEQPINKTILAAIDTVVFWVAFGLSQHWGETEGGERLLAAQSIIMLKCVQQMFIPQAGTTSACCGRLGLKPKISAILSECICRALGNIHQHRQLLRFQQELIYHPPASITSSDPKKRASCTPRLLWHSVEHHLTVRTLPLKVFH